MGPTKDFGSILANRIQSHEAVVAVIGMGYVGLPNMMQRATEGFQVIGVDVNRGRVDQVNSGDSYITDVDSAALQALVTQGKIRATTDISDASQCDVFFIDVPTPTSEDKTPDLSYIDEASKAVLQVARPGALIILESTTYPSTTDEYLTERLTANGRIVGTDIFVAFSPERVDPGNSQYTIANTPRIVGGATTRCAELAELILGSNTYRVSSTRIAEVTKLYENTFRFINIALANEMAKFCYARGMDFSEVAQAAGTKPFGFMPFYPSVAIGGHCIPVDPYYLTWYAREKDISMPLLDTAGLVNDSMTDFTCDRLEKLLLLAEKDISGSRIAILGAAYKKNVNDVRDSAVFGMFHNLVATGAKVEIFDPHIDQIQVDGNIVTVKNIEDTDLSSFDAIVLLTDHDAFNFEQIARSCSVVFDTRNAFGDYRGLIKNYERL